MAPTKRSSIRHGWLAVVIAGAALLPGGCVPRDPLESVVHAGSAADYNHWLYRHSATLGPGLEREFHDLEKERLLALQIEEAGLPPEEIRTRFRSAIDGRTVRQVLSEGYLIRRRRLLADDKGDTYLLDVNHALIVHPQVQDDLAEYRARTMEKIAARQAERRQQIATIEARLRELNPDGSIEVLLAPAAPPKPGPKREKGTTL
ncbi:MAG TPA: hypothetical protein VGD81_03105 [Opitutaceae bacterium]